MSRESCGCGCKFQKLAASSGQKLSYERFETLCLEQWQMQNFIIFFLIQISFLQIQKANPSQVNNGLSRHIYMERLKGIF